jgi:hypothetical protein
MPKMLIDLIVVIVLAKISYYNSHLVAISGDRPHILQNFAGVICTEINNTQ